MSFMAAGEGMIARPTRGRAPELLTGERFDLSWLDAYYGLFAMDFQHREIAVMVNWRSALALSAGAALVCSATLLAQG